MNATVAKNPTKINRRKLSEVDGLKCEVKRQVGLKNEVKSVVAYELKHLLIAWQSMIQYGNHSATAEGEVSIMTRVANMVWDFVENINGGLWKMNYPSANLGVKSIIADYINKKTGKVSLAHYTDNGTYLGSVSKLGDQPIYYDGNFRITREKFNLCLFKLMMANPDKFDLSSCFSGLIPVRPRTKVSKELEKDRKKRELIIEDSDDE